jgi:hypothetical protein
MAKRGALRHVVPAPAAHEHPVYEAVYGLLPSLEALELLVQFGQGDLAKRDADQLASLVAPCAEILRLRIERLISVLEHEGYQL